MRLPVKAGSCIDFQEPCVLSLVLGSPATSCFRPHGPWDSIHLVHVI